MDIDFAPLFQRWYELNFEKSLGYTLQKFTSSVKKKTSKSKSIKSCYIQFCDTKLYMLMWSVLFQRQIDFVCNSSSFWIHTLLLRPIM